MLNVTTTTAAAAAAAATTTTTTAITTATIIIHSFDTALFSALEQTYCVHAACGSE